MNREEAIKEIKSWTPILLSSPNLSDKAGEVMDMAISDLSAIEKIRAEITEHRRKTETLDKYDLLGDALDIIDKHIGAQANE